MSLFLLALAAVFATPAGGWRIAVIGDTQDRPYIFKAAVADMRTRRLSMGVHLGDLWGCRSFRQWRRTRSWLKTTRVQWLMVLGNHEVVNCSTRRYTKWRWTRKFWGKFWRQGTSGFYAVRKNGWNLVAIDSAGLIPIDNVLRMRSLLRKTTGPVMLFMHRPPPHPRRLRPSRLYWLDAPPYTGRHRVFWKLMVQYQKRIKAIVYGHHHTWMSWKLGPFQMYNTGGGGGRLHRRNRSFYHYLVVIITGGHHSVRVVPIKIKTR